MRIVPTLTSVAALMCCGQISVAQEVVATSGVASAEVDQSVLSIETLQTAVAAAYERNPAILAQRKSRLIANERLTQARSANRPQVGLSSSVGYSISRADNQFFGGTIETEAPQTTLGVEVTQNIWSGGRIGAAIGEAESGVDAAQSQLFSAEQQMILNVVTVYMDVLSSEAEVDIRRNNVSVLQRQVDAAQDRFDVGEVTRTDVAQAQARQAGSMAQLASAKANLESNRALFQQLVGMVPVQLSSAPDAPAYPDELEQVFEIARVSNPDLLTSKAAVDASEQRLKAAKSGRRPNIALSGSAGLQQTYADPTLDNENASIVAQLTLPLYQGGLISSQVRAAKLERDQFKLQYRAAERDLIAQVTHAWHGAIASQRSIEASERQVDAAQIAFDGAEQELAVGLRTTLDTLDQEQELLNAKLALIQSRRNYYVAVHQLMATMGQLTPSAIGVNISL